MNCKPDDEQDRDLSIAKRQSEDDEDSSVAMDSSSVAMVEELLSSEYDTEEGGNLPAEHAPHPAPHPASHPAEQDLHPAPQPAKQDPHPAPQPAKRWNDYPLKDITIPHEHDVLFGRGGHTNKHEGNKQYRKMAEDYKEEYIGLIKMDKTKLAEYIVDAWRDQDPPGRFLKKDETGRIRKKDKTVKWYDVGDKKAREKTSQLLREKKPTKGKRYDVGDKKTRKKTSQALHVKVPKRDEFGDLDEFDGVLLTPCCDDSSNNNDDRPIGPLQITRQIISDWTLDAFDFISPRVQFCFEYHAPSLFVYHTYNAPKPVCPSPNTQGLDGQDEAHPNTPGLDGQDEVHLPVRTVCCVIL
ncbi:hypothetical protein FisN_16Hu026 [Fistulifera solaris]|uniref:DUF6824 domain-containing protein n=1 Tax=Fistulifera solaris TaxID=1519565 RepID=A0A1Z5KGU5_FISSO|nr:hypothetical protein FisN_16Hu026 [Fistulifera solaris]|eukprot:GAX25188.1 hypothetical protein FisN_16Hu026 [Fistulifera solaris]